jgi:TPR repeat protein
MKRILLTAAFAVVLAAPAQAQYNKTRAQDGPQEPGPPAPRTFDSTSDVEGKAEELRLAGRCDLAVPILRRLAARAGYEVSRFHLGQCLLTQADAEHDSAQAADLRQEGASWILRAANAGFAQAEALAVTLCLDGVGVEKDPVEAEKWALLYHHNGIRTALNLPNIDSAVSDRLDAALTTATRAQAEARAQVWSPIMRSN